MYMCNISKDYNDRRSERPRPPTCPPQGPCPPQTNETDEASSCPKQDMYVFCKAEQEPCICVTFRIMGDRSQVMRILAQK